MRERSEWRDFWKLLKKARVELSGLGLQYGPRHSTVVNEQLCDPLRSLNARPRFAGQGKLL